MGLLRAHLAALTAAEPNKVFVALWLPHDVAAGAAVVGGESASELHVTLVYAEAPNVNAARVVDVVRGTVAQYAPLEGSLGGVGRFPASKSTEGREVMIRLVDVPGLAGFRQAIVRALGGIGIEPSPEHGYTPHCTLAYIEPGAEMDDPRPLTNTPLQFAEVVLKVDDMTIRLPLGGERVELRDTEAVTLPTWRAERPIEQRLDMAAKRRNFDDAARQLATALGDGAEAAWTDLAERVDRIVRGGLHPNDIASVAVSEPVAARIRADVARVLRQAHRVGQADAARDVVAQMRVGRLTAAQDAALRVRLGYNPSQPRCESTPESTPGSFCPEGGGGGAAVKTPAFRAWFGESKLVDASGAPRRLFHGAKADFDAFDPARIGSSTDAGQLGRGFYFSTDPEVARTSSITVPVYLKAENPLRLRISSWSESKEKLIRATLGLGQAATAAELTAALKRAGYDSVLLDYSPIGYHHWEVVVFSPTQIKSATGNRGTFDPKDNRIDHAVRLAAANGDGLIGQEAERYFEAKSFYVTGVLLDDMVARAKAVLFNALRAPKPISTILADLSEQLAPFIPERDAAGRAVNVPARLETIARTNTAEAVNEGRWATFNDADLEGVVEAFEYSAILDDRVRPSHRAWDGVQEPAEFWLGPPDRRPPNGFQCRCTLLPVILDAQPTPEDALPSEEVVDPGFK